MFLVLTLVFTFPGERGSLFHTSIAIWPWMAALAAVGIGLTVEWMASMLRHWRPDRAKRLFSALCISIAFLVSAVVGLARLAPDTNIETYKQMTADLPPESKVMVGIAPAFYYHTEIPAVSVPNEPIEIVLEAAEQYGVTHLILDQNHPAPLREIYTGDVVHPELQLIEVYNEDVRLFQIK
jgi:hypothetical protein